MACNSCHNHGGGGFDEELLKHGSVHGMGGTPKPTIPKSLIIGGLVLGAFILFMGKKL